MRIQLLLVLAFAVTHASAAQLYRWEDEKGNVEYRDTPPPANAKKVEQRNIGANTIQTSTLPYSLQQAMKNHPVTLWTFDCGTPCASARAHLVRRGVPYSERNGQKEADALKKLTGSMEVPVLMVGSKQLKGYLDSDWDAALDAAGYPRSAAPGFKIPPAQAAPSAPDSESPGVKATKDASPSPAR